MMKRFFLVALILLITGCTKPMDVRKGGDYVTIDHPFTDAGDAAALQRARQICAENKKVVEVRGRYCSLETCTTNYHCEDRGGFKP